MLQIKALQETDPQWEQVCAYAAACSWKAGPFLAKDMTEHLFTGWERVFAAYINEEIAGYCTCLLYTSIRQMSQQAGEPSVLCHRARLARCLRE